MRLLRHLLLLLVLLAPGLAPSVVSAQVAATATSLCLLSGSEPRTLGVFDASGSCVPLGTLNSASHLFTVSAASTDLSDSANLGRLNAIQTWAAAQTWSATQTFSIMPIFAAGSNCYLHAQGASAATCDAVIPSTAGGAGTINGVLAGNGAGIVSQGASTGLTDTANLGRLNAIQTWAALNTFSAGLASGYYTLNPTGQFLEQTSVNSAASVFYETSHAGIASHGIVHKVNRLFVGEASNTSGGTNGTGANQLAPVSWIDTYVPTLVSNSQFAAGAAMGTIGVSGYARASDSVTATGVATGGAEGGVFVGVDDDVVTTNGSIAAGLDARCIRNGATNGICLNQIDVTNGGPVVDASPYPTGTDYKGSTFALGLTAGTSHVTTPANASVALSIGAGSAKFRKGLLIYNNALDTTVGVSGGGVAVEMALKNEIRWMSDKTTVQASIWGDSGLLVSSASVFSQHNLLATQWVGGLGFIGSSAAPTLSTCGTSPAIDANSTNAGGAITLGTGSPTSCTVTYATAYPTNAWPTVTPEGNYGAFWVSGISKTGFTINLASSAAGAKFTYTASGK